MRDIVELSIYLEEFRVIQELIQNPTWEFTFFDGTVRTDNRVEW